MSMICIGCINAQSQECHRNLKSNISRLVHAHGYSVCWGIDWIEPIIETLPETTVLFSLTDGIEDDNCEMLLLPDGWFFNGRSNIISARERMQVLEELATYVIGQGHQVEFFLGNSGTLPDEYRHMHVAYYELSDFLWKQLEEINADSAMRVAVMD